MLLGVVAIAAATFHGITQWRDIARQRAIYDHAGAVEVPAEFTGRLQTNLGLMSEYRGKVRFSAPDGGERTRRFALNMFGELPPHEPLRVRFLPADPADFAVSWAVVAEGRRIGHLGLGLALGLLFSAVMVGFARPAFRRARVAAALALDGREAVGRCLRSHDTRKLGRVVRRTWVVSWQGPAGERTVVGEFPPRHGGPCLVGADSVLLVWSPAVPDAALVLRHDLWPLQLPPERARAVLARIAELPSPRPQP